MQRWIDYASEGLTDDVIRQYKEILKSQRLSDDEIEAKISRLKELYV